MLAVVHRVDGKSFKGGGGFARGWKNGRFGSRTEVYGKC